MTVPPVTSMNSRVEKIRQRLVQALSPEFIQVVDESAQHHGHLGAQSGGGHFGVEIQSENFKGKSLLEAHQMIYQALGEMMQGEIHALRIQVKRKAPE